MKRNVMLDTSVILEGLEGLKRLHKEGAELFVTDIVLQELDGKKSDERVGYHARSFFRALGNAAGEKVDRVPGSGAELKNGDTLWRMRLSLESGEIDIYTLVRKHYRTRSDNDSKIIEVAKDYGFTLVTFDTAQKVRTMSEGVDVALMDETKVSEKNEGISNIVKFIFLLIVFFSPVIILTIGGEVTNGYRGTFGIIWAIFGALSFPIAFYATAKIADSTSYASSSGDSYYKSKSDDGKSTWQSDPVSDEISGVMDYGCGLYD